MLHTFGKEATLTDYYLDDRDNMQYLLLHDLCPSTETKTQSMEDEEPLLIQQASIISITGEHTVAPVIQQIEKHVPPIWVQLKELL